MKTVPARSPTGVLPGFVIGLWRKAGIETSKGLSGWPLPTSNRGSPHRICAGVTFDPWKPGRRWQGFAPAISLPRAGGAEITP